MKSNTQTTTVVTSQTQEDLIRAFIEASEERARYVVATMQELYRDIEIESDNLASFDVKLAMANEMFNLRVLKYASSAQTCLPHTGEFLLHLLLPKKHCEELLGDLAQEYEQLLAKFGERPAKFWFYKQILTSLWPSLQMAGRTLAKWGMIGWLEEIFRRIAH